MKENYLSSFVEGADQSFFPIQNLPYGVFKDQAETARIGVAIGDYVLDLALLEKKGLLNDPQLNLFNQTHLNRFAEQGISQWKATRERLQSLLSKDNKELQSNRELSAQAFIPQAKVQMLLPFKIEGFSDFYASEKHATNVGKLFRPDNPLLPNWKYLPVAYNGRSSTVFVSGTNIPRPKGQIKHPDELAPRFSSSNKLDFELEMGIFVGVGNPTAKPIPLAHARDHLFGLTLLNDWSARDIQAFEYQPLGPFLSKSFATSISPWVITFDAIKAFFKPMPSQNPTVVDYLNHTPLELPDIRLKVELISKKCDKPSLLTETNMQELYWSMEQMLAHHTINGCIMRTGDLLGSGTISGPELKNCGSLLEITLNGKKPVQLAHGETRQFLENGDTVIISGYCENEFYRIGFGSLEGTIINGY